MTNYEKTLSDIGGVKNLQKENQMISFYGIVDESLIDGSRQMFATWAYL
jgi:hypothetical protein